MATPLAKLPPSAILALALVLVAAATSVEAQIPHYVISPAARQRAATFVPRETTYGPSQPPFAWGYFGAAGHTQATSHRSYHGDWNQRRFSFGP